MIPFDNFLAKHDEEAWSATLTTLLRSIHEVDQNATQIWFAFYPVALFQALQEADDPETLRQRLLMQGTYALKDQIDSSHTFLYGHRYWPEVKKAVEVHARAASFEASLADQILTVAEEVARQVKTDRSLTIGITAVAFMTVQQAGFESFEKAPGKMLIDRGHARKSPEQVLRERAKDDSQGVFGFLRTVNKKWTITYDENDDRATYRMNHVQDLAWGAAEDRSRNWREIDPRGLKGRFRLNAGRRRVGRVGLACLAGRRSCRMWRRVKERRSRSLVTSILLSRSR